MLSGGRVHHAFTGTAGIATSVAAHIPGTLVSDSLNQSAQLNGCVRIAHPGGIFAVNAEVSEEDGFWVAQNASFLRTARTLMIGEAFY